MELMGDYYRQRYVAAGLLSGDTAQDRNRIFFRADSDQRTVETARALSKGLTGFDDPDVHARPEGTVDPLFKPLGTFIKDADRDLAKAGVLGRVGGDVRNLRAMYEEPMADMQRLLWGDREEQPPGKKPLGGERITVVEGGTGSPAGVKGALSRGGRFAENLLLEYTEGMPEVGWGEVNRERLAQFMRLRSLTYELVHGAFYSAQVQASNVTSHILRTLQQNVAGRPIAGAIGAPGDRLVIISGHDSNIGSVAGLLGLSWAVDGLTQSPTLPGGALVFELWESGSGNFSVRTYYIAQSLDQMREARPLSLAAPPCVAPIFVPRCGSAGKDFAASFDAFRAYCEDAIEPRFVQP
jgi:4-phytase/acid phosphatase